MEKLYNPDDIRLIITDMDGTLLNTAKELPKETYEIVTKLSEGGIRFVVASGRQYWNIRHLFESILDRVSFIAENGGVTFEDDELVSTIPLDPLRWHQYLETAETIPMSFPVLSGVKKAYIQDTDMDFLRNIVNYYRRFEVIPDLNAVDYDEIIKLSVCDMQNAERNAYPYLEKYSDEAMVKVSGDEWVDINALNCNKGVAIEVMQEKLGIGTDQTMVFGDFLNDSEMMGRAKFSYAMKNAHPALKKLANFQAPSNNEEGVIKVLKDRFKLS
ncbi:MAG: HAD family hydrolase [Eubacteriaceae bacterium]|jgi:Cof subfamily protein (haloacid dehalogenase superfamily)